MSRSWSRTILWALVVTSDLWMTTSRMPCCGKSAAFRWSYSRRCSPRSTPETVARRSEQRGDLGVLLLLELDHEPQRRPVPVDGEPASPPGRRRHVSDKPRERRLPLGANPDHLVAEVENVVLIAVGALAHDAYRYSMTATAR